MDNAGGMYASDTIYYDSDADQMESISPTALHRDVDMELVDADKQGVFQGQFLCQKYIPKAGFMTGYVKVHIVVLASVFGVATGKLVELGIQNAHSIMIPMLAQIALARGEVGMIGQGKNIMPNVHIDDGTSGFLFKVKRRRDLLLTRPESSRGLLHRSLQRHPIGGGCWTWSRRILLCRGRRGPFV